jgi:surface protein
MFNGCEKLTTLDLSEFDTSKVNNMSYMFTGCKALKELIGLSDWNTSALKDISWAFQSLPLTNLDLGGWDLTNCTDARDAWNFMYSLKSIVFPNNLSVSFGIGQSFDLTADNVVEIFNKLATVSTTQTASIGVNLLNKLTEDQIATATNKGWNIS